MAAYNKFNQFVEDLGLGVHDLDTDDLQIYLSNTAPSASADRIKSELAEIATGNGYTGPVSLTGVTAAHTTGTFKLDANNVTITASGGSISTFQYAILMNNTAVSAIGADPLIAWWDYGSAIDLANGESVTITFDDTNGIFLLS